MNLTSRQRNPLSHFLAVDLLIFSLGIPAAFVWDTAMHGIMLGFNFKFGPKTPGAQ